MNELQKMHNFNKKHNKGLSPFSYLNPNAGNVEVGINNFNNSTQSGMAINNSGEAMGENMNKDLKLTIKNMVLDYFHDRTTLDDEDILKNLQIEEDENSIQIS